MSILANRHGIPWYISSNGMKFAKSDRNDTRFYWIRFSGIQKLKISIGLLMDI